MGLKFELENLDGLGEDIAALYTKSEDGKFRLSIDGLPKDDNSGLKSALDKERQSRRDAENKVKDMEKKFEGIEPDAVRTLMQRFANDEEAKLIAEGKLDEVLKKRTERMEQDHKKTVDTLTADRDSALQRATRYEAKVFENGIREAAVKAGILPTAVEDAILRAKGSFRLGDDGNLAAFDADGNQIFGKDGKTGLTVQEWFEDLKDKAPHYYPAEGGSGTRGSGGGTTHKSYSDCKTLEEKAAFIQSQSANKG